MYVACLRGIKNAHTYILKRIQMNAICMRCDDEGRQRKQPSKLLPKSDGKIQKASSGKGSKTISMKKNGRSWLRRSFKGIAWQMWLRRTHTTYTPLQCCCNCMGIQRKSVKPSKLVGCCNDYKSALAIKQKRHSRLKVHIRPYNAAVCIYMGMCVCLSTILYNFAKS